MCTLVILRRPGHRWPVLIGANRDEMSQRPWLPPGRHWPDRPWVVAGLDQQAGGSWLGINDHGLIAGIMNRPQSLGPAAGKRSRGELVLDALDHADAREAAAAFAELDPEAYRPFNLILADNTEAFWVRHAGARIGFLVSGPVIDGERDDALAPREHRLRVGSFFVIPRHPGHRRVPVAAKPCRERRLRLRRRWRSTTGTGRRTRRSGC
jgi:hypothetical protein